MTTPAPGKSLRNICMASYVGSVVEFYDFSSYGTAAALVFPSLLSQLTPIVATIASLGTFAAAGVHRRDRGDLRDQRYRVGSVALCRTADNGLNPSRSLRVSP